MYRLVRSLEREEFTKTPFISLWTLLAFQAGYLNAFGFLASGRYVSHVTGIGTQVGIAAVQTSLSLVIELLGFPIFFILGSFVSGTMTIARLERSVKPYYNIVTLLLPILILGILVFGLSNAFGEFGTHRFEHLDFLLLYLLAFTCGMQNGCFATLTRGQIRTTHLTGISTDIGTDLARLLFGKLSRNERRLTVRVNISRVFTFLGFSGGSVVSVWVCSHLQYKALIVPLGSSIGIYFLVAIVGSILDLSEREKMNLVTT